MKKIIAGVLALTIIFVFFCSCKDNSKNNVSSNITENESVYSEITTESETESKKPSTESKKPTTSKTPSKVESTKSETPKPTESKPQSTVTSNTSSQTQSTSVIKRVDDCLEIGVYHFQPYWTTSYGDSEEERLREFEDVVKQGYFNSFIASPHTIDMQGMWDIVEKYDLNVWMSLYDYYQSDKQTIDEWMEYAHEGYQHVLKDKNRLKYFKGFFFDETIWRGQSNADFLTMTEALYKEYGKRIYVVESSQVFVNWRSKADDAPMDKVGAKAANSNAFKYVTDLGYDHYNYDVRDGALNGGRIDQFKAKNPEIKDGATFYTQVTKNMINCVGGGKNIWFWPCSYTTGIWGGLNGIRTADEAYCLAHIDFFYELLKEQKYQGGLYLYTYMNSSSKQSELGLSSKLIVEDENGNQLLFPEREKWRYVSAKIKNICEEYDKTKAPHIEY